MTNQPTLFFNAEGIHVEVFNLSLGDKEVHTFLKCISTKEWRR